MHGSTVVFDLEEHLFLSLSHTQNIARRLHLTLQVTKKLSFYQGHEETTLIPTYEYHHQPKRLTWGDFGNPIHLGVAAFNQLAMPETWKAAESDPATGLAGTVCCFTGADLRSVMAMATAGLVTKVA